MTGQRVTRGELVAAITDSLLATGTDQLTLRKLAASIGTSHQRLDYHFDGLDDILHEALNEIHRREILRLSDDDDAVELIRATWRRHAAPSHRDTIRLWFELSVSASRSRPAIGSTVEAVAADWHLGVRSLLDEAGVDEDRIDGLAQLILAGFRGLEIQLLSGADRAHLDAAADQLARLVVSAIES
ncbi:MAG: hypothetical protein AAFP84_20410 [Actinomycetota bacterium]